MNDIYPSAKDRVRGHPSDFISPIDLLPPGTKVVLFCRVSGRSQADNLPNQLAKLRCEAERRQLEVFVEIEDVVSAIDGDTDRSFVLESLESAALAALKHGATALIACCTSRFVRSRNFHPKDRPDAQPNRDELHDMANAAHGVTLATLLPAGASPAEERRFFTKLGQAAKGNQGGRPKKTPALLEHPTPVTRQPKKKTPPGDKKRFREKMLPKVLAKHARGASSGDIATVLGLKKMTVIRWIRRYVARP